MDQVHQHLDALPRATPDAPQGVWSAKRCACSVGCSSPTMNWTNGNVGGPDPPDDDLDVRRAASGKALAAAPGCQTRPLCQEIRAFALQFPSSCNLARIKSNRWVAAEIAFCCSTSNDPSGFTGTSMLS